MKVIGRYGLFKFVISLIPQIYHDIHGGDIFVEFC